MRILFTGASSFTGYWFVRTLAQQGHDVVATYARTEADYADLRLQRVSGLSGVCEQVFSCVFGGQQFMDLIAAEPFDVLCHHAADVTDYRSPDFDVVAALRANTLNLSNSLDALVSKGCQRIVLTGSIFEPGEGQGSDGLPAFSPYGLSKGLTAQLFAYYAQERQMHCGKFVIPNPFGPFEEPRFTAYLINTWAKGEVAEVRTPDYIRDNIHVDLLAGSYVAFLQNLPDTPGSSSVNPSGYIESQGAFALRFAAQMRSRTGKNCAVELADQQEFSEPMIRVNYHPAVTTVADWSETRAWDGLASYYASALES